MGRQKRSWLGRDASNKGHPSLLQLLFSPICSNHFSEYRGGTHVYVHAHALDMYTQKKKQKKCVYMYNCASLYEIYLHFI